MLFILSALLFSAHVSALDCPMDACFGEPQKCDPEKDCQLMFKFDEKGNLDLYLRDFNISNGYAAFPIGQGTNETYNYLICLPHLSKRLRANAKLGEPITITKHEMTKTVQNLSENDFICSFPSSELPSDFKREQHFFVKTGTFVDFLVIYDGEQLYPIGSENDEEEYVYYDQEIDKSVKPIKADKKNEKPTIVNDDKTITQNSTLKNNVDTKSTKLIDVIQQNQTPKYDYIEDDEEYEDDYEEEFENDMRNGTWITANVTTVRSRRSVNSRSRLRFARSQNEDENNYLKQWESTSEKLKKKKRAIDIENDSREQNTILLENIKKFEANENSSYQHFYIFLHVLLIIAPRL